jgi:ectoine hydroxylase-related dioxygenase (phytanoyl-CoA dioxygenase family)
MENQWLTAAQVAQYDRDGFLLLEGHFSAADMALLMQTARADRALADIAADRLDREGKVSRLSLRYDLPEDTYGAYVRSCRIVEPLEQLIGGEVYHYHHKMMLKEPFVGGAWEWHQDYGYWYASFLCPDMASCMIAVDAATEKNGCLQALRGSHKMGRLEHGRTGDQTGADAERMTSALERFEVVHCEMKPGTVLFFHSNLLHRSDANNSADPRWALICCYTAVDNKPFKPGVGGTFSRLEHWDDDRVREVARRHGEEVAARGQREK